MTDARRSHTPIAHGVPSAVPVEDWLAGGGEMGAMVRQFDWAATPLGPVAQWPQSLRTALSIMLVADYPMFVAWGPEFIQFYNDAYRPILGSGKHPAALGQGTPECFAELWGVVEPMFRAVQQGGSIGFTDQLMPLDRSGFLEECYFTFSYSPIRDESGGVGGVFAACNEVTPSVIGGRRLRTLRDLAARMTGQSTVADVGQIAADVLAANRHDLPFALLYLADEQTALHLAERVGCEAGPTHFPERVERDSEWPWPGVEALGTTARVAQIALAPGAVRIADTVWPEAVGQAAIVAIPQPGSARPAGLLVGGISPRLHFDETYQQFLSLVATQIGEAIAAARAKEEQQRRAEALAALDRAKTEFFSNVSHEFRTPMTLMMGPLEDLLQENMALPPQQRELVEMAHRNCRRLLRLVNTLLEFSRLEAGRVTASYEPTDLATLTTDLAGTFRSAVERGGLTLDVWCPPLPEPVFVDRVMWEKVVLNLLSNAFKYTLQGGIAVSLVADGRHARLTVRDTGVGIPPEEWPHLFQRFHRVKGTPGRTIEGTGIGLALVQGMVQLHGGVVEVQSLVGEGSAFSVAIPLGRDHLPAGQVADTARPAEDTGVAATFVEEALGWVAAQGNDLADEIIGVELATRPTVESAAPLVRPRLLVVDDNAEVRAYLSRVLGGLYDVQTAEDGQAGWRLARQHPPDLVLSDVIMPKLDGFGLLHELRASDETSTLPVILLSARAGEESRIEGLAAGADDYLIKPFSARELLARVESQLKLTRLRRETEVQLRVLYNEVRRAKNRLDAVLASVSDGFVFFDREWRFMEVSPRAVALLGRAPEELLGRPTWDVFPDTVATELQVQLFRVAASQVPSQFEYFYPAWQRWFEVRANPSPEGVAVFFSDITARKAAEEALRESHDLLERRVEARTLDLVAANTQLRTEIDARRILADTQVAILNALPAQVAILDRDGVIVSVNESWRRFALGNEMSAPAFGVGSNYIGVCESARGARADEALDVARGIRRVLSGETAEFSIEYPCHAPQLKRWFQLMVTTLTEQPCSGAVVMHVDVTERHLAEHGLREREREQRQLAEKLVVETQRLYESQSVGRVGSWTTDLSTLAVTWTPEIFRIFETSPIVFSLTHQGFIGLVHPEDRAAVNEAFGKSAREPGSYTLQHRIVLPDGKVKHVEERWQTFADERGVPSRAAGTCHDITDRMLQQQALEASSDRLGRLSRQLLEAQEIERRRIARDLHDQVGQSLALIQINLQVARDLAILDGVVKALDENIVMVERLQDEVRNLSLNLRPSVLDDLGLVPALRWHLDRLRQSGSLLVRFEAHEATTGCRFPTTIETTLFRLAQEAMTNVLRHAQARLVSVSVSYDEGRLMLRISDDGAGFDLQEAQNRASRGGSMGLTGMEERVRLAGGQLSIKTAPGAGTIVSATLPIRPHP